MATTNDKRVVEVEGDAQVSLDGLETVHALLDTYWAAVEAELGDQLDATWKSLFISAVGEIAGNIVRHAYQSPKADETFHLTLTCFEDRMEAVMLDRGTPYVLIPAYDIPDMRDALDNFELDHGWGLPIAHAATDDLDYKRLADGNNRWLITKRFPGSSTATQG